MTRNRLRTDLGTIRDALAYATKHSNYAAARQFGVESSTIRRWQLRAMREPTGWPTQADVDTYRAERAETAATRRRQADWTAEWRKRVYLTRGPLWVDATGTIRRLRALFALGWTQDALGAQLGTSAQYVSLLTTGRHPKVHRDTQAAVAAVYDRLSMTVPTYKPKWVHDRQRRQAAARGWAVPLAWSEHTIEDPNARPEGMVKVA